MLEAAVNKIAKPHAQARPNRPNIEDLRKRQDKAILYHELAQEKRDKVKKAIEREAPLEDQLAVIGEDSISPLQLSSLKARHQLRGNTKRYIVAAMELKITI